MSDTTFVDYTTPIPASWLNDVNDHTYNSTPVAPATTVHPASVIANTPAGTIAATTVQAAIDELSGDVTTAQATADNHIADTSAAHIASAIANTPAGSIAATDVQAAINELDTEKLASATAATTYAALAGLSTQVFSAATPVAAANVQRWDTPNMASLTVTQGTGALTFAGIAHPLTFRSATLTDGAVSTIIADPADLVLPSGGTLGFTTTVQGRIVVAEMNNAGTSEYAICNIAGGLQLDETNLITTTAIDTASDATNIWYSTTARTDLPYKIVGAVDVVNTAGAWGNPVLVQAAGNLAIIPKRIAQVQTYTIGTVATGTTILPSDNTIPQITEGDQYMSLAITPTNVASLLKIEVTAIASNSGSGVILMGLFQDTTASAIAATISQANAVSTITNVNMTHIMLAGTLSSTTFKVRIGGSAAGTTTFNGSGGSQYMGGVMSSRITITEILP